MIPIANPSSDPSDKRDLGGKHRLAEKKRANRLNNKTFFIIYPFLIY